VRKLAGSTQGIARRGQPYIPVSDWDLRMFYRFFCLNARLSCGRKYVRIWRLRSLLPAVVMVLAPALVAQDDLSRKAQQIEELLRSGEFSTAEPLVRECLKQAPHDIYFLGQLEMSLNGQGKYAEEDQVAANVRQIWASEYKQEWLAKGSPVAESSWARIMISTKDYYAIGVEYFVPHLVEGNPSAKDKKFNLMADYKVIALPKRKDAGSRIFQLNKTAWEKDYWLEEYSRESINTIQTYAVKPDIRAVTKAVADYLDQKVQQAGPTFSYPRRP
jgi:hypothetical protein